MPKHPLNEMLRALRTSHWPERRVLQSRVADALGVTGPSVSSYEKDTLPPDERLNDYALFFATPRWLDPAAPRRVFPEFLNGDEQRKYEELRTELRNVANQPPAGATAAPTQDFWTFPPGEAIRVFCGELTKEEGGRYATPAEPNFMKLRRAADVDSLVELWGHLRTRNPTNNIRLRLGTDFNSDDLNAHLVILGNIAQEQGAGVVIPADYLPVKQVHVDEFDGEIFEAVDADGTRRFGPTMDGARLVEDVGLLARVPSPHATGRMLTICSGVFTRGVYGAVRATTDNPGGIKNITVLPTLVDLQSFALLFRVRVTGHVVGTPDLSEPSNVLYRSLRSP